MKISKLFHWLYAILMLLPFAFFVPSVLYYAFNDNATMQSVEVPKTETIAVDFNQLADVPTFDNVNIIDNDYISVTKTSGNWVSFAYSVPYIEDNVYYVRISYVNFASSSYFLAYSDTTFNQYYTLTSSRNNVTFTPQRNLNFTIGFVFQDGNVVGSVSRFYLNVFNLTQMFGVGNEPTSAQFDQWFPNNYYPYTESELMQITYDIGETEQLVENTGIINYAWESIWDLPLFNWCKVTFVSIPFAYLTALFGIGANSTLNYVFGYFVTISICWLVFDVIMYVPMLVHRWIDKARIE